MPWFVRVDAPRPTRRQKVAVNPEQFVRRLEELRALAPVYKDDLDAFFQRHPELAMLHGE